MLTPEEKHQHQIEATRRWRERHPEKVKAANRKPRKRKYDPMKSKAWRLLRLAQPGYRKRINKVANARAQSIRDWINAYKLEKGCVDCGYHSHAVALDFDHIGTDKSINVCNAKSISQAQKEIAKCVVRCSNCHRIRTVERLHR